MAAAAGPTATPISLHQDEDEALWFARALATIKASAETTGRRVVVTEPAQRTLAVVVGGPHRSFAIEAKYSLR